jgi:murein DD-endopeptidase MepM/ murein hydrolase activator NlpD
MKTGPALFLACITALAVNLSALTDEEILSCFPSLWPTTSGRITLSRGPFVKYTTGKETVYEGISIHVPVGTDVFCPMDGTVIGTGSGEASGQYVVIQHANGFRTSFWHMSKILVEKGDKVKRGQLFALSGNTGVCTGPVVWYHILHSDKSIDPLVVKDFDVTKFSGEGEAALFSFLDDHSVISAKLKPTDDSADTQIPNI